MTAERIELDFEVTPEERAHANDFLTNLTIIERHGLIGRLLRPPLFWLYGVPCTIMIVPQLTGIIGEILQGHLPDGFGLMSVIGYAMAIYFLGYEAKLIWTWVRRRLGLGGLGWIGRKGVHWGIYHLTATADALILEGEKSRTTFRWPAVLGIEESRRAHFLMLTRHSAVVVPKSAFASPALQQSFRELVNQRIVGGL